MGPDAPGPFGVAQGRPFDRHGAWAGQAPGRGEHRPYGCMPYGYMVGRAGERWKGEVAVGAMVVLTSEALGAHMKAVQRHI